MFIDAALSAPVPFGSILPDLSNSIAGNYVRLFDESGSAEITITDLPNGLSGQRRCFVSGCSLYGTNRPYGPNMGELSLVAHFDATIAEEALTPVYKENVLVYSDMNHNIRLIFKEEYLSVEESWRQHPIHGMNVNFSGLYSRRRA